MRWFSMTLLLSLSVSLAAQTQTPEEREIRQTYARITLASEIGAVENIVLSGSKKSLEAELADNRVEFRLSDFRVGNVSDHLLDRYGDFVSRPQGQDHLLIATNTTDFKKEDGRIYHNVCASAGWEHGGPVAPIDWDDMPLSHALDAAHATDGSTMTRFASYTVQTTFKGETQTTRASWFFGSDKTGKPTVYIADYITDMGALQTYRVTQSMYPYIFLDDPDTRNNPAVLKWLKSVAQDCPGGKQTDCFDQTTGKIGFSREDVERGPIQKKGTPTSELRRFEINQCDKGGSGACQYFDNTKSDVLPFCAR